MESHNTELVLPTPTAPTFIMPRVWCECCAKYTTVKNLERHEGGLSHNRKLAAGISTPEPTVLQPPPAPATPPPAPQPITPPPLQTPPSQLAPPPENTIAGDQTVTYSAFKNLWPAPKFGHC